MDKDFNSEMISDFFDQEYVINLPERRDRKKEISEQLERVGLSLRNSLVHFFPAVRAIDKGPFPSVGARGFFMSHLRVLEHAIGANHNSILILQDDVDWTPAALAAGNNLSSVLKGSDWNYLHGGLGNDTFNSKTREFHPEELNREEGILLFHFVGMRRETIAHAHSYFISVLGRPSGSTQSCPLHVDSAYNWRRKDSPEIKRYVCLPSLARQRPSTSDITPNTGYKGLPLICQDLGIIQKIKKTVGQI